MTSLVHGEVSHEETTALRVSVRPSNQKVFDENVSSVVSDSVASGIASKDASLWGPSAESEAAIRLNWVDLPQSSRALLAPLETLAAELRDEGITRVLLCGMGGSSLGPEVVCKAFGVPLTVVDATDPSQVAAAFANDLDATVVVVSSKSGGTVETDSQRRVAEAAFTAAGIDPRERIVVVTDPGSPLEETSRSAGYRAVFLADPQVGGRYSVLSAFGLVPVALAGVPVRDLLDQAEAVMSALHEDSPRNPAIILGSALVDSARNKVVIQNSDPSLPAFGDWIEQLVAESTGKDGTGILPVITHTEAPEKNASDVVNVMMTPVDTPHGEEHISLQGTLGAQIMLWEHATAIAGRLLEINPFDQPDVESAKSAARQLLEGTPERRPYAFIDSGIEVRGTGDLLAGISTVEEAYAALLGSVGPRSYLALQVYLNREEHAALERSRDLLARRLQRPVTFGWGPRFLHSTGQYHKGGPREGVFLQITGSFDEDLPIPGRDFGFTTLIHAQADGDASVLEGHGMPVVSVHLTSRSQVDTLARLLGVSL